MARLEGQTRYNATLLTTRQFVRFKMASLKGQRQDIAPLLTARQFVRFKMASLKGQRQYNSTLLTARTKWLVMVHHYTFACRCCLLGVDVCPTFWTSHNTAPHCILTQ